MSGIDDFIAKAVDGDGRRRLGVAQRILRIRRRINALEGVPICSTQRSGSRSMGELEGYHPMGSIQPRLHRRRSNQPHLTRDSRRRGASSRFERSAYSGWRRSLASFLKL
jgi:hypothetical protein